MGIGIDLGTFFQNTYSINDQGMENIFDFINASIAVAAKEKPKEFLVRRSRIIEALLMASPMDDIEQDSSTSSSSNFSCESPLDDELDNQFDGVTSAPSKPINLVTKEKGCGVIQSVAFDGENKDRGKKFRRKIETEDAKHEIDARNGNKGLGLDEVKFEATKRKFEGTSLGIKKGKRKIQILDFKDIPQSKPIVDENRFNRGGFKKPSFRRR
ncbi:Hypothetical predicted protein [Olea europaea subsp. europaea]|uniref:Uncharacterized protein n=1 Tax=Olea europaea subsp. europaea TaxID=158383 RepID=A0A8S0QXT6_OLEEU|nr:Hypothetical predicted protein [Olea europaea subsp. europaea]